VSVGWRSVDARLGQLERGVSANGRVLPLAADAAA
jgi:hypothetical protein